MFSVLWKYSLAPREQLACQWINEVREQVYDLFPVSLDRLMLVRDS